MQTRCLDKITIGAKDASRWRLELKDVGWERPIDAVVETKTATFRLSGACDRHLKVRLCTITPTGDAGPWTPWKDIQKVEPPPPPEAAAPAPAEGMPASPTPEAAAPAAASAPAAPLPLPPTPAAESAAAAPAPSSAPVAAEGSVPAADSAAAPPEKP